MEDIEPILELKDLPQNPTALFTEWFSEYANTKPREPSAMVLATAAASGSPAARTVLLKGFGDYGFVFFTNYGSNKSQELAANPVAQLLFYWEALGRQVRVHGSVGRVSEEESDVYFASRPYLSQIGAWASRQSQKIKSREELLLRVEELKAKYPQGSVPRPPHWGGFCLKPESFEFWIGRENRLHDRFLYERKGSNWEISRLSP